MMVNNHDVWGQTGGRVSLTRHQCISIASSTIIDYGLIESATK